MLDSNFRNLFSFDKKIKKQFNHKPLFDKMLNLLSLMDIDKQIKENIRDILIETRYILNKSIKWKQFENLTLMYYIVDNHKMFMKNLNNLEYDEFDRGTLLLEKTKVFHDIILSFEKGALAREDLVESIKNTLLNSGQLSEEDIETFLSLIGATTPKDSDTETEEQLNEILDMIKDREENNVSTDKTE